MKTPSNVLDDVIQQRLKAMKEASDKFRALPIVGPLLTDGHLRRGRLAARKRLLNAALA